MTEPKKDELLRAPDVADLDPYNTRGKPKHDAARELLGEEAEEAKRPGVKFSERQKLILAQINYRTFSLNGRDLSEEVRNITGFDPDNLINTEAYKGEIALVPQLYLEDSKNKTLKEQMEMLKGLEVSGTEATIGTVTDYINLAKDYIDRTGKVLLVNRVRTRTKEKSPYEFSILISQSKSGEFLIGEAQKNVASEDLFIMPLIIPYSVDDRA